MSDYLGPAPGDEEEGGPDQGRAPARPSATQAAQLGIDYEQVRSSLDVVRSRVEGLVDQQRDQGQDLADLRSGFTEMGEHLEAISAALESDDSEQGEDQDETDSGPASVWTEVPEDERAQWLDELRQWVRRTLFVQWPHTQHRLRWCWPLHMDIVSDLALLRRGYSVYTDPDGRWGDAEHWRRAMDYLLKQAEDLTAQCPKHLGHGPHPDLPSERDDSGVASLVPVMSSLVEALRCLEEGDKHLAAAEGPDVTEVLRADHRHYAEQFQQRSQQITREAGITGQQWELFMALRYGSDDNEPGGTR